MPKQVIIVGAGLAGLAAAVTLAPRGWRVLLLEARPRLGGRAGSFVDQATGQWLDACQHVSMGCCTAFADFCRTVGIDPLLESQPALYFRTPDGRVSRWRSDALPPPWHLARTFAAAHFLSPREKLLAGAALLALRRRSAHADEPLLPWLKRHGQTARLIDRFWAPVLVSALNENLDRIGTKYARKVFVDAFLSQRTGGDVTIPKVPLERLYGSELQDWLRHHRVEVRLQTAVRSLLVERDEVVGLTLRDGEHLRADAYVVAVPWHRVLDLLPEEIVAAEPALDALRRMEASPITSVHLWYDRPLTSYPHLVLLDSSCQWLFRKGETSPGEHYHQVVVSAARALATRRLEEIEKSVAQELATLFPAAEARLLRARAVRETQATFSVVPGVDGLRPLQRSPLRSLYFAGDWTRTGWPATMEGAVRSGWLAAEALRADARVSGLR